MAEFYIKPMKGSPQGQTKEPLGFLFLKDEEYV